MSGTRLEIGIATADFYNLSRAVRLINSSVAEAVHLDIMDGVFVPQITYGAKVVGDLRPHTRKKFDAHLMLADPLPHIESFARAGADIVHVHVESKHVARSLDLARSLGIRAGLAIRLETPLSLLFKHAGRMSSVIVMCAETGFAGKEFSPLALPRIADIRRVLPDVEILADGGINFATARRARLAGASGVISGSFVFAQEDFAGAAKRLAFN
ncbi:MAG: ribulose-phosphate 3-epimerase [Rickettsiales bacterium]|nr:ribulose-phosphate 3-epimerase [Rickettsiales bacterium]